MTVMYYKITIANDLVKVKSSTVDRLKVFVDSTYELGTFDRWIEHLTNYGSLPTLEAAVGNQFGDLYVFSDLTSLYFKGVNLFPAIFGDQWRKYVPVESREEIRRQLDKTINKKKVKA